MRLKSRRFADLRRPARREVFPDIGIAAGILALVFLIAAHMDNFGNLELGGRAEFIDGDTLRLSGQRIRLVGLDAPEIGQLCKLGQQSYPCGRKALYFLKHLAGGKTVACRGRDYDRYGRLLAVCHVGKLDLNARMVSAGWAVSYGGYHAEEREAREATRGLWAGQFEWPAEWRATAGMPPGRQRGFFAGIQRAMHRLFGVSDD